MKDIIKSIQAVDGIKSNYCRMEGYEVVTDKHKYLMLIDEEPCCCENWGYFASEDDLQYFIGANLIDIQLTDTALNKAKLEEVTGDYFECGGIQFIDFETDRGVFQLAVYNARNGYYGHSIEFRRDDEVLLENCL